MTTPFHWISRLAALIALCIVPALALMQIAPPAPRDGGEHEFSATRALAHVKRVARAPHPVGSAEHAVVRDYIVAELTRLGASPTVQRTTASDHETNAMLGLTTIENVVARLPGTTPGKALLLVGHYDSVPTGPGASDDGHAVAVLLETLRALRAGPPLAHDVVFLFSDGEELGLLGARAFAASPEAKDIALALNFEARGTGGPAFMFQSSSAGLARMLGEAAPWPMASSLLDEVYRRLPNDTDLSALMHAGIPGMNFAYFDRYAGYHSQRDSVEALDPASLQQQGDNALALARHFSSGTASAATGDASWFHVTRGTLIWYPRIVDAIALAIIALGMIALVVRTRRRGQLRLRALVIGGAAMATALVACTMVARIAWAQLAPRVMPDSPTSGLVGDGWIVLGFLGLALAGTLALCRVALRWARVAELALGALVVLIALAAAVIAIAPGAAYLLVWPAAGALVGAAALATAPHNAALSGKRTLALVLGAAVPLWLIAPWLRLLFALVGLPQLAVIVALGVVLIGCALPALLAITDGWRWRAPLGVLVLATATLGIGLRTTGATPAQPAADSIAYALDTDAQRAAWITDQVPDDAWTARLIGDAQHRTAHDGFFPFTDWTFYQAPATAVALPAPQLVVIANEVEGGDPFSNAHDAGPAVRHLQLRVTAGGPAESTLIYLVSSAKIRAATIAGQRFDRQQVTSTARWAVRYTGAPRDGFELALDVDASAEITLRVVDQYHGLAAAPAPARPGEFVETPFGFGPVDQTYVGRTFRNLHDVMVRIDAPTPSPTPTR